MHDQLSICSRRKTQFVDKGFIDTRDYFDWVHGVSVIHMICSPSRKEVTVMLKECMKLIFLPISEDHRMTSKCVLFAPTTEGVWL
jgi:hypothetical protein